MLACQLPATLLRVVSLLGIKADPDADIVPRTIMIGGKVFPYQLVYVWRLSSNLMNKEIGENNKMSCHVCLEFHFHWTKKLEDWFGFICFQCWRFNNVFTMHSKVIDDNQDLICACKNVSMGWWNTKTRLIFPAPKQFSSTSHLQSTSLEALVFSLRISRPG